MSSSKPDYSHFPGSRFVSVPLTSDATRSRTARPRVSPVTIDVSEKRRKPATLANWIGWIGVPLYSAFLLVLALLPGPAVALTMPEISVNVIRSINGAMPWITFVAEMLAIGVGRFAPLGFLMVLALPRRRRFTRRMLFVGLPAFCAASLLSTCLLYAQSGARNDLGAVILAATASALGVWVGMSWLRGWTARLLMLPKLAGAAALIVLVIAANLYASLQAQPFEAGSATPSSAATRRVFRLFKGKNPKSLAPGEVVTLRLSDKEINDVLAWGAYSMLGESSRLQVELAEDSPHLLVSAPSPITRGDAKFFNLIVGGGVRFANGHLELDVRRLRLGSLEMPRFMLAAVSPQVTVLANNSPQLRPLLAAVQELKVSDHDVVATYGHADLPSGMVAALFEGDAIEEIRTSVKAQVMHLVDSSARTAPAETRFGASVESAFRYARERSRGGDAVLENEAAILALGMLLGHGRVEQLVGPVIDISQRRDAEAFEGARLRQREDWTKHFLLSASISVLSTRGISDGVGLFKEELDSDGGSGFSFGDLLADRAGVTFAVAATQNEASARAIQDRLAGGYREDDYMPVGADLPENMQQAEFRSRFGGVGGLEYRKVTDDIERRIASCGAYRTSSGSASRP
jgi:hypothetical protein